MAYVDKVIDLLELTDIQNALIGVNNVGLGVEQRKRVTIAVECVPYRHFVALRRCLVC